jgi:tetratricopeptide (TPR) repeat protein
MANRSCQNAGASPQNGAMESSVAAQLKAVDPAELGGRVRAARVARGLTQTALGHPEASAAYVSRIESGQRRPGPELLETFASRLGVPVSRLLDQSATLDPDEVRLQLNYAELALESGEVEEAERQCATILEGLTEGTTGVAGTLRDRACYLRARALEAKGLLEDAIEDLEQVRCSGIADLQWVKARVALSRCYRETGDLGRAVDCARPALDALADAGLAHCDEAIQLVVTVAAAYYERGDCAEAQRLCRRAVERAERDGSPSARASAYWNASMIESRQGSVVTAVSLAQRAIALLGEGNDSRNLARLRSQLGTMQLMTEGADLDEAERTLIRADEELRSSSAAPLDVARNQLQLCKVLILRGEPQQVHPMIEAVLRDVGEGAPDVAAEAQVIAGQAWAALGDPVEAQGAFRRAVQTLTSIGADRTAAELWFELGALWESVGNAEASRDAYRSAAASAGVQMRLALPTRALVRA